MKSEVFDRLWQTETGGRLMLIVHVETTNEWKGT